MADPEDVWKSAGSFFKKLGGTVKEVATTAGAQLKQTTKQVTGLGRGTVKLELEQTRVAPGGLLRGRVVLVLTEPIDARELIVTLRARQRLVALGSREDGRAAAASHTEVFQHVTQLEPARTFVSGEHPFEIDVPADACELRAAPGDHPLVEAVRSVASALSADGGPIEWQVVATLAIAWGRDLTHDVDIVVAR